MLDIPEEKLKLTAFCMLTLLKESMDKELKEIRRMVYDQIGNTKKEVEIIKINQIENLELKSCNSWNEEFSSGVQQ